MKRSGGCSGVGLAALAVLAAACVGLREQPGDGGRGDAGAADSARADAADVAPPDAPAVDSAAGETPADSGEPVASVGPPSLNACKEFLHYARAPQCDDARNVDDWGLRAVAFSPDGKLLAAAGQDAVINLWTVTGSQLDAPRAIPSPSFEAIAFSRDGMLLATAGNSGRLNVYRVADGQKLYGAGGFEDVLYFTGFAHDNDRFFTTIVRASKVDVWSVSRMSKTSEYTAASPLRGVAVPAPGSSAWTLLAGGVDGQLRFVDLDAPLAPASPPFAVAMAEDDYRLALSPDGKWLAVSNPQGVFMWNVSQPAMPRRDPVPLRLWSPLEQSWAMAFSPTGRHLAVTTTGSTGASVAIYSVEPHVLLAEKPLRIRPQAVAFSPDGRGLAVGLSACGVLVHCRD